MSIARITCSSYRPGHDIHVIALNKTFDRPGIDGTVTWVDDHAVFHGDDGITRDLWNHRPSQLRSGVALATSARLLVGNHFLWLTIVLPEAAGERAGETGQACINVSFEPCKLCGE